MLDEHPGGLRKHILPVLLAVAVGVGLGYWHNVAVARGSLDPVTLTIRTALAPVVAATDAVFDWFGGTTRWLFRGRELARENAHLRAELARLKEEIHALEDARERVKRLEKLAGLVQEKPPSKIAARVLSMGNIPSFGTLVIGVGSRHGVRSKSVVVTPEGLVGCVYDVAPTSSVVLLATDPRASVGARVLRAESRAVGICRGTGGRRLRCTYFAREADIRVGDTLITSGLGGEGGTYPPGIVIGRVVAVTEDLSISAKSAIVETAVDPSRLEEVAVLR